MKQLTLRALVLGGFVALLASSALTGQSERERANVRERIGMLTREAEELLAAGRPEEAQQVLNRAKQLKTRFDRDERRAAQRRQRAENRNRNPSDRNRNEEEERDDLVREGSDDYYGLFHHLESAVDSLRKLGRIEQAERLQVHARELRQSMVRERGGQGRRRAERERAEAAEQRRRREEMERDHGSRGVPRGRDAAPGKIELTERQVAAQQIEVMKFASSVLAEAKRGDASASLQRAAKVLELRLAGRGDAEAQTIYAKAPGRGANAEHLMMAAEILADQGRPDRADIVRKVARQVGPREGRDREAGPRRVIRDVERSARAAKAEAAKAIEEVEETKQLEETVEIEEVRESKGEAVREKVKQIDEFEDVRRPRRDPRGNSEEERQLRRRLEELERAVDELQKKLERARRRQIR